MADPITVQQWADQYNQLSQNLDNVKNAITKYISDYGAIGLPILYEAQRLQLRLEYQLNQHIESAYTPELMDTYFQYQGQKIEYRPAKIDGILYNNVGQPLAWDPDTTWGLFNQLREVKNMVSALVEFFAASELQNLKGDIVLGFSEWLSSTPNDMLGNMLFSRLPKPMADTLTELMGKALPNKEDASKAFGENAYDNIYEFFFGDYDPSLDGLELSPSVLNELDQSFRQKPSENNIQTIIDQLNNPVTDPAGVFEKVLDFFKPLVGKLLGGVLDFFISPAHGDIIDQIKKSFDDAETIPSPIMLDLDGNGVETRRIGSGAYFDHASDGFAERTGWVGRDDGLLVRDLNGNGAIDSGRELFGSETLLANEQKAANGFEALRELDANNDGVIDANDAAFAELRVWRDANGNGRTDTGELLTLEEAGVKSINVNYITSSFVDAEGNAHRQTGSYTTVDGQTRAATDVWVRTDPTYSVPVERADVPEAIAALPDAQGYGKVRDLHQAMAMDATGELKALVTAFTEAATPTDRDALVMQIIYRWTGVQDIDPASRASRMIYGNAIGDARKLEALEEFMGEEWEGIWCWGTRDPNPHGRAAPVLLKAWDELKGLVYGQLMAQSHLKELFLQIAYGWDEDTETVVGDLSAVAYALTGQIRSDREAGLDALGDFLYSVKGMGLLNSLDIENFKAALLPLGIDVAAIMEIALSGWVTPYGPTEGNDVLRGTEFDDILDGQGGNDRLFGRGGNDTLIGGPGNDILDGGAGNDILRGGTGSDIYRFGRGDGHDIIIEDSWLQGETDRIELKAGLTPDDVRLERVRTGNGWQVSDDLVLTIRDTGETLTVKNHFNESYRHAVEEIVFADGSVWDMETIKTRTLIGTGRDDVLYGFNDRDDTILGGAGNDRLIGLGGDDTLDGGAGDDVLIGGAGSDTYRFGLGYGHDLIIEHDTPGEDLVELGAGIAPEDIAVRWTLQGDMAVTLPDGSRLTVQGQANTWSDRIGIERLRFADGTEWNRADLAARALSSTFGDDDIVGGYGDDMLDGGPGNDRFRNLGGYDTYRFGIGDGHDVIEATRGRIQFKPGIGQNDIGFSVDGNDLTVSVIESGDSIHIKDWLSSWQRIDRFEFANGARLTINDVETLLNVGAGGEVIFGSPGNDTLIGTAKDSIIFGREGDDVLEGGAGRDDLYGEAGDDILDGGPDRDRLFGGEGRNTYILAPGSGLDQVLAESSTVADDTVQFAPGIQSSDVSVQLGDLSWQSGLGNVGYTNLVVGIGGDDAFLLQNRNGGDLGQGAVQRFRFADGTELTLTELIALADGGKLGWQQRYHDESTILLGSAGDDEIYDYTGQSVIVLARGNDDTIELASGNDIVSAGTGNDTVYAGQGDDLIAGEAGDDVIDAGDGDDTVVFNYGDGHDRVTFGEGLDTLSFGNGIEPALLSAVVDRESCVVLLVDGGAGGAIILDGVRIGNLPGDLERIQFIDAEGQSRIFDFSSWLNANRSALLNATVDAPLVFDAGWFELTGQAAPAGGLEAVAYAQSGDLFAAANLARNVSTDGDDVIYGTPDGDVIDAGADNDIVLGLAGDDTIFGGVGNDLIFGGDGDDRLFGGDGDDVIYGGWGADTLSGGPGRDEIYGEWGGDTYLYQPGDGVVIIDDDHRVISWGYGGEVGLEAFTVQVVEDIDQDYGVVIVDDEPNILSFGPGIRPEDLRYSDQGGDLLIEFADRPDDKVILRGYRLERATKTRSVDIIRFADGTEIIVDSIEATGKTELANVEGGWLTGTQFADTLIGGDGDDIFDGRGGADLMAGGSGSDTYRIHKENGSAPTQIVIVETWREQDVNRIELTGEINADDLHLAFYGHDLLLRLTDAGDTIRFVGFDPRAPGMQAPVDEIRLPWRGITLSFADLLASGIRYGEHTHDFYEVNIGDGVVLIDDLAAPDAGNVLRFGPGIDPWVLRGALRFEADGNGGHVLLISYGNEGDVVRLTGFKPDDVLGQRAVERFEFDDGTVWDYATLVSAGFLVEGNDAANELSGTNLADRLFGGDGDDIIWGGGGSDELHGGPGNDVLIGGEGDDAYVFHPGDGIDTIIDSGATDFNYIRFGTGIRPEDIRHEWDDSTLILHYGNEDAVRIVDFHGSEGNPVILALVFEDGSVVSLTEQMNRAPVVTRQLDDIVVPEDLDFSLNLPADLFSDPDPSDEILISVRLANDEPLPTWLSFDPVFRTLSGRPTNDDVGNVDIVVEGKDHFGASATTTFNITVQNTNNAPEVGTPFSEQRAVQNTPFSFMLPSGSFYDMDAGDVLAYSASLENGDPLPSWLSFDAQSGTFSGTPANADVGEMQIRVVATDLAGVSIAQILSLTVLNVNDAPEVGTIIADVEAMEDEPFTFTVPDDAFFDVDAGDLLSFSASISDGAPLPAWLDFDATTRHFSGTPDNDDVGNLSIRVTATDLAGAQASQSFGLSVINVNDAPEVGVVLTGLAVQAGSYLNWQLPENTFYDVDAGDVLSYSAGLAGGCDLPDWLVFDPESAGFSGTPAETGVYSVQITATDLAGAQASQQFTIDVVFGGGNRPPVTAQDQAAVIEDRKLLAWGNVLANDSDPDGDSLHVADPGIRRGEYGVLKLLSNGGYVYLLDNFSSKVQGLGAGESAVDRFAYLAHDGTDQSYGELAVTVQGTNDIPVLSRPLADVRLVKGKDFSWQVPVGSFTDRDRNDRLSYSATLSDGQPLPGWLDFDNSSQTFSGKAPSNAKGTIDVQVVVTDGNGEGSEAADGFRISFGNKTVVPKGNEGVGNGQDAPPPGHSTNQNDGPGTGPGRPGNKHHNGKNVPLDRFLDGFKADNKKGHPQLPVPDRRLLESWLERVERQPEPTGLTGEAKSDAIERHWRDLTQALAKLDAERHGAQAWSGKGQGADLSGLLGILSGNTAMHRLEPDVIGLAAGGTQLKSFAGLRGGLSKLIG